MLKLHTPHRSNTHRETRQQIISHRTSLTFQLSPMCDVFHLDRCVDVSLHTPRWRLDLPYIADSVVVQDQPRCSEEFCSTLMISFEGDVLRRRDVRTRNLPLHFISSPIEVGNFVFSKLVESPARAPARPGKDIGQSSSMPRFSISSRRDNPISSHQ